MASRLVTLSVLALCVCLHCATAQQWGNDLAFADGRGQLSFERRGDSMMIRAEFNAPRTMLAVGVAPFVNEDTQDLEGADVAVGMPGNSTASRFAVTGGKLSSTDLGDMQSTYSSEGDVSIVEILRPLAAGPNHVPIQGDVYLVVMWPESKSSNRAFFHHINVDADDAGAAKKLRAAATSSKPSSIELSDNLRLQYEMEPDAMVFTLDYRGPGW
jgi:hypothetical protein